MVQDELSVRAVRRPYAAIPVPWFDLYAAASHREPDSSAAYEPVRDLHEGKRSRWDGYGEVLLMWGWRIYQVSVVVFFLFADIYFEWGMGGLAAGVVGGMVAWYSSVIIGRILWRRGLGPRFGIEAEPELSLLYRPPDAPPARPEQPKRPAGRT